MAEDWAVDVKKYAPDADDAVIASIVRYCGIALRTRDAALVSFSDKKETGRVRDGYCRKKLALTETDDVVDKAIADVGAVMKGDRTKNRVTVYYLLAEKFGKLELFGAAKAKAKAAPKKLAAAKAAAPIAAAPAAVKATASKASTPKATVKAAEPVVVAKPAVPIAITPVAPPPAPVVAAVTLPPATPTQAPPRVAPMAAYREPEATAAGSGRGKLLAILALLALAGLLLWWLFGRSAEPVATGVATETVAVAPAPIETATPAPITEPATSAVATPAPALEATPVVASVTATEVDGKPAVSVFFANAKSDVSPDFATVAAPVKAWIDANPGAQLVVTGFNDPTGDAKFNAKLAKSRAFAVRDALVKLGIPTEGIELVKPVDTNVKSGALASGRRVDISVKDAG